MTWVIIVAALVGIIVALNFRPIMRALARLVHWHPGD